MWLILHKESGSTIYVNSDAIASFEPQDAGGTVIQMRDAERGALIVSENARSIGEWLMAQEA